MLWTAAGRDGCGVDEQVVTDTIHHGLVVYTDGQILLCRPAAGIDEGGIGVHIWLEARRLQVHTLPSIAMPEETSKESGSA